MSVSHPQLWNIPKPSANVIADVDEKRSVLHARLKSISSLYKNVKFASSLAAEDLVITHAIIELGIGIEVFTLQTGRLHEETLHLLSKLQHAYPNLKIQLFYPDQSKVDMYESLHGKFAFYESVELRRECCFLRKIEPLSRALEGADAWLTGQRREQSVTRTSLVFKERDNSRGIDKYNPIFDWSESEVWAYVLYNNIPYNALYNQGFPSIGCEPCTRAIRVGEDIRSGRWWWESKDTKECGLHK